MTYHHDLLSDLDAFLRTEGAGELSREPGFGAASGSMASGLMVNRATPYGQ
jgi:hypothetical protein